jgi:hypothetical protein
MGSESPLAAFAHRTNWIIALKVRFLQFVQCGLHPQRKTASRPKWPFVHKAASVNLGSLQTFAAFAHRKN